MLTMGIVTVAAVGTAYVVAKGSTARLHDITKLTVASFFYVGISRDSRPLLQGNSFHYSLQNESLLTIPKGLGQKVVPIYLRQLLIYYFQSSDNN